MSGAYAKDSLDRSTGRRFNMAAMRRSIVAAQELNSSPYRGFEVSGGKGHWYVSDWQTIYTSEAKAKAAVDACLALRELLATA